MFRLRSGLSQRELSLLLGGKHGSKVSRYERRERVPSPIALFGYEAIFNARARDLFVETYEEVRVGIFRRARKLARQLDAQSLTPAVKRKVDFLTDLIFPPKH